MNLAGKRIAVIGGAGLIGSHLTDALVATRAESITVFDNFVRGSRDNLRGAAADARVRIVAGTILDRAALDEILKDVDGVFLLASLWLGECLHEPRTAWEAGVMGSWNVVEACLAHDVKRVVYSSSASVYGNALAVPMTEDHPFNNRTTYGATKIACEQMLRAVHDQHKLPYVALRYMNVYGPRMDDRGTYVSVIVKVLDRIARGERPVIFGDGSQTYDFIDVADVARANLLAMEADCADEAFNVGYGTGTTINELVRELLSLTESSLEPEYRAEERSFVTERIGSIDKAESLLGFRAAIGLREGLQRLIDWRARG